jgi:type IV secretion system protein VirB10
VAAALVGVLASRGPEAVLAKGTTLEMVLDRPVVFDEDELEQGATARRRNIGEGPGPLPSRKHQSIPAPGRRLPL